MQSPKQNKKGILPEAPNNSMCVANLVHDGHEDDGAQANNSMNFSGLFRKRAGLLMPILHRCISSSPTPLRLAKPHFLKHREVLPKKKSPASYLRSGSFPLWKLCAKRRISGTWPPVSYDVFRTRLYGTIL